MIFLYIDVNVGGIVKLELKKVKRRFGDSKSIRM